MAQRKQRYYGNRKSSKGKTAALVVGAVLAFGAVAGGLAVALDRNEYRDLTSFNYTIGSIDSHGAINDKGKTQVVTDFVNAKGLKVTPRADSKVKFKVLYYDEYQDFLSMTEDMTTTFTSSTVPAGAVFARVSVTPTEDEDGVISLFEKIGYTDQLIITVTKETPKVTARTKLTGTDAYLAAMKRDGSIVCSEANMDRNILNDPDLGQYFEVPVDSDGNMDFTVKGYLRTRYEYIAENMLSGKLSDSQINEYYYGVHTNISTLGENGQKTSKGIVRSDKYQTVDSSFMTLNKVESSPELTSTRNWLEYCKLLSSSYVTISITSDADTVTISYDFEAAKTYKDKFGFKYDIPDAVVGEWNDLLVKYTFDKGEDFENFSIDLLPSFAIFVQL